MKLYEIVRKIYSWPWRGTRQFRNAFNFQFYYVFGYHGSDNSSRTLVEAVGIQYTTPNNCLSTNGNGNIYSGQLYPLHFP